MGRGEAWGEGAKAGLWGMGERMALEGGWRVMDAGRSAERDMSGVLGEGEGEGADGVAQRGWVCSFSGRVGSCNHIES